jgi:hypothetical protein
MVLEAPNDAPFCRDPDFVVRWQSALAKETPEQQKFWAEVFDICLDIEEKLIRTSRTARDCNVILARMNGSLVQFLATDPNLTERQAWNS